MVARDNGRFFREGMAARAAGRARTDLGTILIHWVSVAAMIASLVTGFRLAADAPYAVMSRWLEPILLEGEVWTIHFIAGLALLFSITAYSVYVFRAGLAARNDPGRLRILTMRASQKVRWGAVNIALHWFLYALVVLLAVTGVFLYLGHSGWFVTIHRAGSWAALAYIFVHTFTHFMFGGIDQLLRLFRPQQLQQSARARPRPLAVAVVAAVFVAAGAAWVDLGTRAALTSRVVAQPPQLDAHFDDAAWREASPVTVRTQQGENLRGVRGSVVEVRSVHDAANIYFAFRWQDPTRSLMRMPLIKKQEGWFIMHDRGGAADVMDYYEDKFAILFSSSDAFGSGDTTHLGPQPIPGQPNSPSKRGLHYTRDGSYQDLWQWKGSRGGLLGHVDDQYFGPPMEADEKMRAGHARYQGGYTNDPGKASYTYNYGSIKLSDYTMPVTPVRLPRDLNATLAGLGPVGGPDDTVAEGARWWMTAEDSVEYTPEVDARIPVGTIIPGVLHLQPYEGDRADVRGSARWEDGWWYLEAARPLATGSKYDTEFAPGRDMFLWFSVFDHNQIRHTRHVRPVTLSIE